MPLSIVEFEEKHLEPAMRLLAADQKRRRAVEPVLPSTYEAAEQARGPLEETLHTLGASGVAAEREGRMVAFLLAVPRLPDRGMAVPFHGYAAEAGEDLETYRELYGALADGWVRRGFFGHSVTVLHGDRGLLDCWSSLGFGRILTVAVRDVREPVKDAPELDIRQAGPEDIAAVAGLLEANGRHHNTSPIFTPYIPESIEQVRSQTATALEDVANGHFIAYEDGEPVGMNTFLTDQRHSPLLTPEKDIYLFQGIVYEQHRHGGIGRGLLAHSMRWAREQGYTTCTLHYLAPNIVGARFWTSNGFRPIAHILVRRVDERMAWARPELQVT
jgi:GNAT superfamily N-acetyltransferase